MVINDFNLVRPRIGPPKADAILLIDANAMLPCPMPNGLEMSRPANSSILSQTRFAAAGRGGSIELLGGQHVVLRG